MMDWSDFLYTQITSAALVASMLGLLLAAVMPGLDRWSRRFFLALFSLLVAFSAVGVAESVLYAGFQPVTGKKLFRILDYLASLLSSIHLLMLTVYLLHCCEERVRGSALFRVVTVLWAVFFILLQFTLFSDKIWNVTLNYRGPWYPYLLLPLILILALDLAALFRWRGRLTKRSFASFLVVFLPLTVGMLVQLFRDFFWFLDVSLVLSVFVMFSFILSEQIEQSIRQNLEIANQRASIMVLQMRPHFIFNTMMSIYALCGQDPKKARSVTKDFTTYLRKNFTAIMADHTIPFSEELEHTRAYLAVEEAQFEEALFVEYDTPHTQFRLPPLTLQPIVENAVKHGLDPGVVRLTITIRTRETESGSELTVEDNSPGFEPTDSDTPGIALENIRQRMKMMCGGRISVTPREGGGTVVTLTVPGKAKELMSQ